jgi:dethiobiotin synthetase
VAARLLSAWRRAGLTVAARKPAQSFVLGHGPTDADVLAEASAEEPATVCPVARSYPVALAPPMAADVLGRPVPTIADLVAELSWPRPAVDIGLVETAGGVRSPQAADGDVIDMISVIAPDRLLLVADAGLGTINAVRLTVDALVDGAARAPVVVLNRFDPSSDLHRRNRAWLHDHHAIASAEATDAGLASLADLLAQPLTPQ